MGTALAGDSVEGTAMADMMFTTIIMFNFTPAFAPLRMTVTIILRFIMVSIMTMGALPEVCNMILGLLKFSVAPPTLSTHCCSVSRCNSSTHQHHKNCSGIYPAHPHVLGEADRCLFENAFGFRYFGYIRNGE